MRGDDAIELDNQGVWLVLTRGTYRSSYEPFGTFRREVITRTQRVLIDRTDFEWSTQVGRSVS